MNCKLSVQEFKGRPAMMLFRLGGVSQRTVTYRHAIPKWAGVGLVRPFAMTVRATISSARYSTFNANHNESTSSKQNRNILKRVKSIISFSASGILIVGATGIAGVVLYLILSELFSPTGDTQLFNRAVSYVEGDANARNLLQCYDRDQKKERLKAYGDSLHGDKWTRNRPITSTKRVDKNGKEHHFMKFRVESAKVVGVVSLEAVRSDNSYKMDFLQMYLDVPGHKRYYLIKPQLPVPKPKGFLGINWGPRKD
ncbi:HFL019Wp [Eremothecium sinecaudum]|uniref:Mitochondrial import inner membrane translocase subunit Tim21 n=1 Tax=Eremothecium sinecaudum TaxID=45286 RepID=A0A0X8HUS1_9SACH|nr:HFL019Wp [Eremothecium sinecaudum]AMD21837.1 HFL019Wp [Eremothecium sinecaudum]